MKGGVEAERESRLHLGEETAVTETVSLAALKKHTHVGVYQVVLKQTWCSDCREGGEDDGGVPEL